MLKKSLAVGDRLREICPCCRSQALEERLHVLQALGTWKVMHIA